MDSATFSKIVEFVDEGVIVFGSDLQLEYSNRAFQALTGYTAYDNRDALRHILVNRPGIVGGSNS